MVDGCPIDSSTYTHILFHLLTLSGHNNTNKHYLGEGASKTEHLVLLSDTEKKSFWNDHAMFHKIFWLFRLMQV